MSIDGVTARLKRQRADLEELDEMVPRERHPLNKGKRPCHHSGLPGKLYNRHDIISLITDSMALTHHRLGWCPMAADEGHPLVLAPPPGQLTFTGTSGGGDTLRRSSTSEADRLYALGLGPAPEAPATALCSGCSTSDAKNFSLSKDKEHVCGQCGVVSCSLRVATHREKACTEEDVCSLFSRSHPPPPLAAPCRVILSRPNDRRANPTTACARQDKTTHADKPWDSKTDQFDNPALTCVEVRQQRERETAGTRVSKKAKEKFGLGWTTERAAREAAKAQLERSEMDGKDLTKGQHIQIALDQLFTPLEPLDSRVKRFCRMEADRAWRMAVRHAGVCERKSKCPLRFKERGAAVIADAVLACSLDALVEGTVQIDGVTHSSLLVVANKLGAQNVHRGMPCALRSLRTVVASFLASTESVPSCPSPKLHTKLHTNPAALGDTPSQSGPSTAASRSDMPFARVDSSASDFGEPASWLMQLRDAITVVHKALGTGNSLRTRDRTFAVVQESGFRAALGVAMQTDDDVRVLSIETLAYCLLASVAKEINPAAAARERRATPVTLLASFGVSLPRLEAAIASLSALMPPCPSAVEPDADDLLFG